MGRRGVWSANRWHGVLSGISNKGKKDMHLYYIVGKGVVMP